MPKLTMILLTTVLSLLSMSATGVRSHDLKYLQPWLKISRRHVMVSVSPTYTSTVRYHSHVCKVSHLITFEAHSLTEMQEVYTWLRVLRIYGAPEVTNFPIYMANFSLIEAACNLTSEKQCCVLDVATPSRNYSSDVNLKKHQVCAKTAALLCELPDDRFSIQMSVSQTNTIELMTSGMHYAMPFKVRLFVDGLLVGRLRQVYNGTINRYVATFGSAGVLCGRWIRGEMETSVGHIVKTTPSNGTGVTAGCIDIGPSPEDNDDNESSSSAKTPQKYELATTVLLVAAACVAVAALVVAAVGFLRRRQQSEGGNGGG